MVAYIEETAAYVRVSSEEQKKHGLSIDAQKQKLEEYAEKHDLKIVEWYIDEGVSGRKPIAKRPQLQRMIHDAEEGRFKRIIFIKLDRYFRSVQEYYACQSRLDTAGVTWTATEEKYSLADANGRAFVNMKLTIAELEADTTGERIQIVNQYKIKSGLPLFGTHSFPFCFAVEQKEGEKHKSIVKQDEEIMDDLIAYVMLNPSIRGGMLYINGKYNRNFTYKMISTALRSEMICGSYGGNPNYCPAYITREQFDKLQILLDRSPRTSTYEHTYFFTGLLRCPSCGRRLNGQMHINRGKKKTYIYYTYRCPKYKQDRQCNFSFSVFENKVEKEMLERIEGIIEEQKLKIIEMQSKEHKVNKHNVAELQAELERLNYAWQKGRIKRVEEYDEKYDKLTEKINAATSEAATTMDGTDFDSIATVLNEGWKEVYNKLDDDHKKAFWRSFVKEIHLDWSKERKTIKDIIFF